MKPKDLTGQVFGRLTVLRRASKDEVGDRSSGTYWLCQCACGNKTVVLSSSIVRGKSKSCGCLHYATRKGNPIGQSSSIIGKTFGELTVIAPAGYGKWTFLCSCGVECVYRLKPVIDGEILSCGHIMRQRKREQMQSNAFGFRDGTEITTLKSIVTGKWPARSSTGVVGVSIRRYATRIAYVAQIDVAGKHIYIGQFAALEDAIKARKHAEDIYFSPLIDAENDN